MVEKIVTWPWVSIGIVVNMDSMTPRLVLRTLHDGNAGGVQGGHGCSLGRERHDKVWKSVYKIAKRCTLEYLYRYHL